MLYSQFVKPFGLGAILAVALVGGALLAGPLLFPQNESSMCQILVGLPSSFQGYGFLTSRPIAPGPYGMQFVIKPNSTAFLQINYTISNPENITAQTIYANWSEYIHPIQYWDRLGSTTIMGLNTSTVGMTAIPVNVTASGTYVLSTTYEVSALANAEQGAYIASWFSLCGPVLVLTVGYALYTGPGLLQCSRRDPCFIN
jgi:hypothetical protein